MRARRAIDAAVRAFARRLPGEWSATPLAEPPKPDPGRESDPDEPRAASGRPLDLIEAWEAVILGRSVGPDPNDGRSPD